tara:strand:+ start:227 stop:490 length:264 start_codon:yes stop_codon:yes gene_type:complete
MKKDKYIIAKVGLVTYFFVMGTVLVLNNWAEKARIHNELLEIEMSVNELRYYVNEDVFSGNLKEDLYEYYTKELYNIEESIKQLKDE